MATTATAIRFPEKQKALLQAYADAHDITVSAAIRGAVAEQLEDWLDAQALEAALAEDDGVRFTHAEIKAKYGL